jgi:hypothetical protein
MPNPWDRPRIPKRGNKSDRSLFEALGRALNAWEEIEISMAHLYAEFTQSDRFEPEANLAYGEEANFNRRAAMLQRGAQEYFVRCPSQVVEGEFCRLMNLATGYSARRNDIAHSHVLPTHFIRIPDTSAEFLALEENPEWWLVPPHFRANKFTSRRLPAYAFTSSELNEFRKTFWDLAHAFSNLSLVVHLLRFPPSLGIHPKPAALPYRVRAPRTQRG